MVVHDVEIPIGHQSVDPCGVQNGGHQLAQPRVLQLPRGGYEPRPGPGTVTGAEEGDLVATLDESVNQGCGDHFQAAVPLRGKFIPGRRDHRDAQPLMNPTRRLLRCVSHGTALR